MIRVMLPFHLRRLSHVGDEVQLQVDGPATLRAVLDALEAGDPMAVSFKQLTRATILLV
jgi:hypothetical protein